MFSTRFVRNTALWASVPLLAGAALSPFAIIRGGGSMSEVVRAPLFQLAFASLLVGLASFLMLLIAHYDRHRASLPRSGTVGFWAAATGTIMLLGSTFAVVFVLPAVAEPAASVLDEGPPIGVQLSFLLFAPGWVANWLAVAKAGIHSRRVTTGLIAASALSFGPILPVGLAATGIALLGLRRSENDEAGVVGARSPRASSSYA